MGDGYYEPVASIVYTYEGQVSRTPNEKEVEWIIERCRYNPRNKGPLGGVTQSLSASGQYFPLVRRKIRSSTKPFKKAISHQKRRKSKRHSPRKCNISQYMPRLKRKGPFHPNSNYQMSREKVKSSSKQ